MPNVGISMKAKGMPNDNVKSFSFMSIFVSPRPARKLFLTKPPKRTRRLVITYNDRKNGA